MLTLQNIFQSPRLFMAVLVFCTFSAHAEETVCSNDYDFVQTIEGSRPVGEAELLAQNHDIGLYRGGSITLKPWIDISENAVVGIDQVGNVVQVLEFTDQHGQERRVAVRLSYNKIFKSVFLTKAGQLFAIDNYGELHVFSWDHWRSKKAPGDLTRIKKTLLRAVCGLNAVAAVATVIHSTVTGDFQGQYFISSLMGTVGLTMTHMALASHKYEVANESTNGFLPTNKILNAPIRSTQYLWRDDQSGIKDFTLYLENREQSSLVEGLNQVASELIPQDTDFNDFDLKCEHTLLARGLSEAKFEAGWRRR